MDYSQSQPYNVGSMGLDTAPDEPMEGMEPESYLEQLKTALLNEKTCPDILKYKSDLVDGLREEMTKQVGFEGNVPLGLAGPLLRHWDCAITARLRGT